METTILPIIPECQDRYLIIDRLNEQMKAERYKLQEGVKSEPVAVECKACGGLFVVMDNGTISLPSECKTPQKCGD